MSFQADGATRILKGFLHTSYSHLTPPVKPDHIRLLLTAPGFDPPCEHWHYPESRPSLGIAGGGDIPLATFPRLSDYRTPQRSWEPKDPL